VTSSIDQAVSPENDVETYCEIVEFDPNAVPLSISCRLSNGEIVELENMLSTDDIECVKSAIVAASYTEVTNDDLLEIRLGEEQICGTLEEHNVMEGATLSAKLKVPTEAEMRYAMAKDQQLMDEAEEEAERQHEAKAGKTLEQRKREADMLPAQLTWTIPHLALSSDEWTPYCSTTVQPEASPTRPVSWEWNASDAARVASFNDAYLDGGADHSQREERPQLWHAGQTVTVRWECNGSTKGAIEWVQHRKFRTNVESEKDAMVAAWRGLTKPLYMMDVGQVRITLKQLRYDYTTTTQRGPSIHGAPSDGNCFAGFTTDEEQFSNAAHTIYSASVPNTGSHTFTVPAALDEYTINTYERNVTDPRRAKYTCRRVAECYLRIEGIDHGANDSFDASPFGFHSPGTLCDPTHCIVCNMTKYKWHQISGSDTIIHLTGEY